MNSGELFVHRKSLDEICSVPEKIISVYALEQHVWEELNSDASRTHRKPELRTIEEFQIDPVRPFLTDILRNMAAPWKRERKGNPVGQGYWIQAEFGSGKTHLLCFLSALALGHKEAWDMVKQKEEAAGRGKRESLYRFWEEGIDAKSNKGSKGIFVIVKTLVGSGGGTIGVIDKGRRLSEYIIDAAKAQIQIELNKNISLYPAELLADRFINEDLNRYRKDLAKFLRDPHYFEDDEFEEIDDFIQAIQSNNSPDYKRSCGNKLWLFYTEYLKVRPHIEAESEEILAHMVEAILAEGYNGILLVLDEVSLFMKDREENQRVDDEKTLVVLSNRLAKVHNLPIWTVCAAQQAVESKMGVKNIIADDRLKLVNLLEEDTDYYNIVLARVREIIDPTAIANYYLHYKRGFTWPNSIGDAEFRHFFPFHKPALEALRAITYELTTARSAIHFMHQTLKQQIKSRGRELIRLWDFFDEAVSYEEDPSGVYAGLVAIKTKRETDYLAYEASKRQIDSLTKGILKVHRDKAVKIIQTLFLYHITRTRQQGITSEEIANSVLIERDVKANPEENIDHYETLAQNLKMELRQVVSNADEEHRLRYRFDPVFRGIDPKGEFQKAKDEAESNEAMQKEAWEHLLALQEWRVLSRQMTLDLSNGIRSIFSDIAPWKERGFVRSGLEELELEWEGRQIKGRIEMLDFGQMIASEKSLPPIETDQTDHDFAVYIGTRHIHEASILKLIERRKDPRVLVWTPAELTQEERDRLIDFAAYRKLISKSQGKDTEDAMAVINWVSQSLQLDLPKIAKVVENSYARGRVDALNNTHMEFRVAGGLVSILTPLVTKVLTATYLSRNIQFEPPFVFKKDDGVKVINGIVKTGRIPKGAKTNQHISAALNFGYGLKIMKKNAEKELDVSDNSFVQDLWSFISNKLDEDGQTMKLETLYKNFMGIGGPKDYGLTRRMVQIFLLCLVQRGQLRIIVGSKSGLDFAMIDYSNISKVDFSSKLLDGLVEIQKVAKPENWEVLVPFAEKLLGPDIPDTHDDAIISDHRQRLRQLFKKEKENSVHRMKQAQSLFDTLKTTNPYEKELAQFVKLFSADLEEGDDIRLLLYALKDAMGYQAFDTNVATPEEVDDLAIRMKNYHDIQKFLGYESKLRTAHAYCTIPIGEQKELTQTHKALEGIRAKLRRIKEYVDSEVKLKTGLIGSSPPIEGEADTIEAAIQEYTSVYIPMHEMVVNKIDSCAKQIRDLIEGVEIRTLKNLDRITEFSTSSTDILITGLNQLLMKLFSCPTPSRVSVENQLQNGPLHECNLSFANANDYVKVAEDNLRKAHEWIEEVIQEKMKLFLHPTIRERLEQGRSEPPISELLACEDLGDLRAYWFEVVRDTPEPVEMINRYLKKIHIKHVKIADFTPGSRTIQREQINHVVDEFRQFLETQFAEQARDDDSLPMLQLD